MFLFFSQLKTVEFVTVEADDILLVHEDAIIKEEEESNEDPLAVVSIILV
jgi:hypothetical protein